MMRCILAAFLLIAMPAVAQDQSAGIAAPPSDGPYVAADRGGTWTARRRTVTGEIATAHVRVGQSIAVSAADGMPEFRVRLRARPPVARSVLPLDSRTPLMVVADTHGEFGILVTYLQRQHIVDAHLKWRFGRGHLVVTGDMLDRGPHQVEIVWLLYKLEAEAAHAGGRVHVLLGNHETMVLKGDLRYLNPRYPDVAERLGAASYAELLGPQTVLGHWLRSRPAMLKLGDLLFVHGGVSPELVASPLSLEAINAMVRTSLDVPAARKPAPGTPEALVMGTNGPVWYRGYFPSRDRPPATSQADVDASLARFGVSRILVGHTIVERVSALYDGKVIAVQVYPTRDPASGAARLEGALRLQGRWYRATAQGERIALDR